MITCLFSTVMLLLILYVIVMSMWNAFVGLIVKNEDDAEALRFIIGCIRSKVAGAPMPEKPSYIGASSEKASGSKRRAKTAR